jgi:hypothetical protein
VTINTIVSSNLKKPDLISILRGTKGTPLPSKANAIAKTLLEAVVWSNFVLSPLNGESAELCKLGHHMELIYGMNILNEGKEGKRLKDGSVLDRPHLFRAGLLQKCDCKYQKDSPDFIVIGPLDGKPLLVVVKIKC